MISDEPKSRKSQTPGKLQAAHLNPFEPTNNAPGKNLLVDSTMNDNLASDASIQGSGITVGDCATEDNPMLKQPGSGSSGPASGASTGITLAPSTIAPDRASVHSVLECVLRRGKEIDGASDPRSPVG